MPESLLILAIEGFVLLALWRWDERTRRAERQRRHLEFLRSRSAGQQDDRAPTSATTSPSRAAATVAPPATARQQGLADLRP